MDEHCDVHVSLLWLTLLLQPDVGWSWLPFSPLSPPAHFITPPFKSTHFPQYALCWTLLCFLSFFLLASMAPSAPLRSPHGRLYSLILQSFIHCIKGEEEQLIRGMDRQKNEMLFWPCPAVSWMIHGGLWYLLYCQPKSRDGLHGSALKSTTMLSITGKLSNFSI